MFFAAPRWSPDGRWIVAERLRLGFVHSDIVLIDVQQRTCADSPICGALDRHRRAGCPMEAA